MGVALSTLGYPIIEAALGLDGLQWAVLFDVINVAVGTSIELDEQQRTSGNLHEIL